MYTYIVQRVSFISVNIFEITGVLFSSLLLHMYYVVPRNIHCQLKGPIFCLSFAYITANKCFTVWSFNFKKRVKNFTIIFFRCFAVVKKVTEGLFWGRSMVISGTKSTNGVNVLVEFCYPAVEPQYIIKEFEQKSSDFAWQKTVIPGPHHIFNPDNFYVFSFGKS